MHYALGKITTGETLYGFVNRNRYDKRKDKLFENKPRGGCVTMQVQAVLSVSFSLIHQERLLNLSEGNCLLVTFRNRDFLSELD